jgi:hypothetical protein
MFADLMKHLKEIDGLEIHIVAEGEYPTKQRTKVQHVAKWQNDGTDRGIKPAKFVEAAVRRHRGWQSPVFKALGRWMFYGEKYRLKEAGLRMAYDMNTAVNRIRTGRLKKSFRPQYKTKFGGTVRL